MTASKHLVPVTFANHELVALGIGFAVGLLIGGFIGADGKFPDGSWVLLAAFVAGSFVLFQVRQNAINTEVAKIEDWKRQRRRVYEILIAQIDRAIAEYEFVINARALITRQMDEQIILFKESLNSVKSGGVDAVERIYDAAKIRRRYFPSVELHYLDENPNCIEYLHSQIVAQIGGIQMRLKDVSAESAELIHVEIARGTLENAFSRNESLLRLLTTFKSLMNDYANREE